jgi:hypothetical protein
VAQYHPKANAAIRKLLEQHGPEYPLKQIREQLRLCRYWVGRDALTHEINRQRAIARKRQVERWKPVFEKIKANGSPDRSHPADGLAE